MRNSNLHKAKVAKNDEFYTMYEDVEKELALYWDDLQGKSVYCPCDAQSSAFVRYLTEHFHKIGLKSLSFSSIHGESASYDGTSFRDLKAGSSFEDNIELIRASDVIITNPPFSLFRTFYSMVREQQFLILGPMNVISYSEISEDLIGNRIWLGKHNGSKRFCCPDGKEVKLGNVWWYTNLGSPGHKKMPKSTPLPKYIHYANVPEIIHIPKLSVFPHDHDGMMAVPFSYLPYHDPDRYQICGVTNNRATFDRLGVNPIGAEWLKKFQEEGGKGHYTKNMKNLVYYDENGKAKAAYARIIIRKQKEKRY